MDNNGNFTLEILVVGMIILMILGIISVASEISQEKISKSVENNNIEKAISEVADTLINDPGSPINWEDFKSKRVRDYENLVTKRLFDNKFHSSMELIPRETSISSVKIGSNDVQSNNVFSANRLVKCDFFKKYVICDFSNDGKCNHNHNQKDHSCNYFKLFKGNLKKTDYYLLINDSERLENKYSIDTTHFKSQRGESISSTRIYLNDKLNELFEVNDTSSIVFIHFDKKDTKAVLVGIPRDFDKNKLNYNYFTTQPCDFVIKAWS